MRTEARVAACWWASRLGNCTHNAGMRNVPEMELTIGLNLESRRGKYDAATQEAFAEMLEGVLDLFLSEPQPGRSAGAGHRVAVEYGPDAVLVVAARLAGVDLDEGTDLPVKTWMRIDPGKITVSEGYGGPVLVVWEDGA